MALPAVKMSDLSKEAVNTTLGGLRGYWSYSTIADGLTPETLSQVLKSAVAGYAVPYLTLAEEIEERDLHYASVLGTRKRAVTGLQITVESASDDPRDQDLAEAVRGLTARPEFRFMLTDLMDALGKGYSAVELIWNQGEVWEPQYAWRDPRYFRFDRDTQTKLQIADGFNEPARDLMPMKFIVHVPHLKSGLPIRGGLARLALFGYLCKRWTIKDWMAFADIYGVPLRLGIYEEGTKPEDVEKLLAAVLGIGNDAAAVIKGNMRIEFPTAPMGAGGDQLFQGLADWWDRQLSKGILGQTMTTDNGSSLSQAKVHNEVREDILIDDAQQVSATINRDLIRPFIDLNFGPQKAYPRVVLYIPDEEDLALLITALKELVPLGLRVEQSVIRDKLGLPDPPEGVPDADLLMPAAAPPAPPAPSTPPDPNAPPALNRARNRIISETQAAVDQIAETAMQDAGDAAIDPERIKAAVLTATNRQDLEDKLLRLFTDPDRHNPAFRRALVMAEFAAQVLGYVAAEQGQV